MLSSKQLQDLYRQTVGYEPETTSKKKLVREIKKVIMAETQVYIHSKEILELDQERYEALLLTYQLGVLDFVPAVLDILKAEPVKHCLLYTSPSPRD